LQNNKEELFVTVFMAVLNLKSGVLDYVCAGHNPPLIGHGPQPGRDLEQREDHGEGQNVGTSQGQLPQGSTDTLDAANAADDEGADAANADNGTPQEPGAFRFMSAEHNLPMLGVIEDLHFVQYQTRLAPGDTLFMYTDGVNEAMNAHGLQFGNEKLQKTLDQYAALSPEGLCRALLSELKEHAAGAEQSDDITMLALRYQGIKP
ncbi:MAG: serine/threonine-protein phosphatase, partial [Succinivibrio sp.]|nr:serine/threonine-protein phosphatase [Succinivibrio sp.]